MSESDEWDRSCGCNQISYALWRDFLLVVLTYRSEVMVWLEKERTRISVVRRGLLGVSRIHGLESCGT